jgi:hypothetical protein
VLGSLYFRLDGIVSDGDDHYNGHLQDQSGHILGPYQTTTHETIYTVSVQLGHAFILSNSVMLIPFADIGYHGWNRQILGAFPATEYYSHKEIMAGGLIQVSPFKGWIFSLSGEAGSTFSPTVDVQGGPTLSLNEETIYRFEGKVGYALNRHFEATTSFRYEGFGYGSSAVALTSPITGISEPQSYTHQMTGLVGIAYHL